MTSADAARPSATRRINGRLWVGGAVSLILVVWAAWALDWRQVWGALKGAHAGWIVLAIVTVLFTIAVRVTRWQGLLLPRQFRLVTLLTALLAGQVVSYVSITQAGWVVRAAALGEGNRARALGTVALEKLWDVVMLLGLTAALSVGLTLPNWLTLPARLLAVLTTIAILSLLAVPLFRSRASFSSFVHPFIRKFVNSFSALLDGLEGAVRPPTLLWGLLSSSVIWGLGAATNYCVLRAFGLSSAIAPALLLLAALQAGVAVPSLPVSVGVFEGICVAVLVLFGIGQERALAAGLALHAVVFAPPLLLGGLLMGRAGYHPGRKIVSDE